MTQKLFLVFSGFALGFALCFFLDKSKIEKGRAEAAQWKKSAEYVKSLHEASLRTGERMTKSLDDCFDRLNRN